MIALPPILEAICTLLSPSSERGRVRICSARGDFTMADSQTQLPILRCFKGDKLVYEISTSKTQKYSSVSREFKGFDWIELIEPIEGDAHSKRRVLISCTTKTDENLVRLKKNGKYETIYIKAHIRDLSSPTSTKSYFTFELSGFEAKLGDYYTFCVSDAKIDGHDFSSTNPPQPIFHLAGATTKESSGQIDLNFLARLGFGLTVGGVAVKTRFAFIGVGDGPASILQSSSFTDGVVAKLELRIGKFEFSLEDSRMSFGQKTRVVYDANYEEHLSVPYTIPGLWTLWSLGYQTDQILKEWNDKVIASYSKYVYQRASFVPFISRKGSHKGCWCIPVRVCDRAPDRDFDEKSILMSKEDPADFNLPDRIMVQSGPVQPISPVTVNLKFDRVRNCKGKPIAMEGELRYLNTLGDDDAIADADDSSLLDPGYIKDPKIDPEKQDFSDSDIASLLWINARTVDPLKPEERTPVVADVRLGAFELNLPAQDPRRYKEYLSSSAAPYRLRRLSGKVVSAEQVKVAFEADLPLSYLVLAGQDVDSRDSIDAAASGRANELLKVQNKYDALPVLIGDRKNTIIDNVHASISENNFLSIAPRISIRIKQDNQTSGIPKRDLKAIVLDNSPFGIVQVQADNLFDASVDEADLNEIAIWLNWDPDGVGWKLLSKNHQFSINLPPQCLGEDFVKARELTDPSFLNYKFSPNAKLTVQTDDETRRFGQSPWNIRRILGYPSDRIPGCKLLSMKFELLYGMDCIADTSSVGLTEIFARLGWTPDYAENSPGFRQLPTQLSSYRQKADEWNQIKQSLQSRLSILAPFERDKVELTISENIVYKIRESACLEYPISEKRVEMGDWRRRRKKPFVEKNGLKGGATWGFESANVLDSLMTNPKSTSGKVVEPHFSAMGGWGYQKAVFQNGLTKIYSNTSMGRTFFYSVERLGRIAVFGNVAKHVVIYERTVSPSEQFDPEQPHFYGMPMVRKVKEFIELIEPIRSFPDTNNDVVHRGFTKAIDFNSKVIFVNSNWGEDIGTLGWAIPLWNKNAAKTQPEVYPKPLIALHCVVPKVTNDGQEITEPILIDNPEIVYFYTCTLPNASSDPHQWGLVSTIDFPITQLPVQDESLPGADLANPDSLLPGPSQKYVGLERFTFELVDSDTQPNLCAGRSASGMAVKLKNVTLCRMPSTPIDLPADAQILSKVTFLKDHLLQLRGLVNAELEKVVPDSGYRSKLEEIYRSNIKSLGDGIGNNLDAASKWVELSKTIVSEVETAFNKMLDALEVTTDSELQKLFLQIDQIGIKALREAKEYVNLLDENLLPIQSIVRPRRVFTPLLESHAIDSVLTTVTSEITRLSKIWKDLRNDLDQGSQALLDLKRRATELLERIVQGVQSVIDAIETLTIPYLEKEKEQILTALAHLLSLLEQYKQEVDTSVDIAGLKALIDAKETEFFHNFETVKDGIKTAILQLESLFAQYTSFLNYIHEPSVFLRKTLQDLLTNEIVTTEQLIDSIKSEIEKLKNELRKELEEFKKNFASLTGPVEPFKRIVDALSDLDPTAIAGLLFPSPLPTPAPTLEDLKNALEKHVFDKIEQYEKDISKFVESNLAPASQEFSALRDSVINLHSATCKRLNNPPFNLNREEFRAILVNDELKPALQALITPSAGLLARAKDELGDLKSLGMRIPTNKLFDRVLPTFDGKALGSNLLSDYFPDLAGLKLDGFMKDLTMEKSWEDKVIIQQGIDPSTGKAWLRTRIKIPISQTVLFEKQPIKVTLVTGEVFAESYSTVDTKGVLQQATNAHLSGDWIVSLSGSDVLEFQRTKLYNDAGGDLKFDVEPSRINLKGVLGSVSDLMSNIPGASSAFEIARVLQDLGKPIAIDCDFDMALPDIAGGCFSLKGLKLNAGLGISVTPTDIKSFAINTRLSLCRKDAPFIMTIFCLGGGGWFEYRSSYLPLKNRLATFVSIGVSAGASFDIALGPMKGGISMTLGIGCEFSSDGTGKSKFAVVVIFTIKGEVDLCGIVSAYVSLSLSLTYERSEGKNLLIGRGRLEVEIEICWCFTLSIEYDCEYSFVGGDGKASSKANVDADIDTHAQTYIDSLN